MDITSKITILRVKGEVQKLLFQLSYSRITLYERYRNNKKIRNDADFSIILGTTFGRHIA